MLHLFKVDNGLWTALSRCHVGLGLIAWQWRTNIKRTSLWLFLKGRSSSSCSAAAATGEGISSPPKPWSQVETVLVAACTADR